MTEVAWAAGFFDGEGHTWGKPGSIRCGVTVSQADSRVLERFRSALGGLGQVHGPYIKSLPTKRPVYEWRVTNWADAQAVVAILWAFLSEPKREQASRVLRTTVVEQRRRVAGGAKHVGMVPSPTCGNGHARVPGLRYCRECHRLRNQRYARERKEGTRQWGGRYAVVEEM